MPDDSSLIIKIQAFKEGESQYPDYIKILQLEGYKRCLLDSCPHEGVTISL